MHVAVHVSETSLFLMFHSFFYGFIYLNLFINLGKHCEKVWENVLKNSSTLRFLLIL